MSEYRTDEETLEQIQRWWRENGMTLIVTVALSAVVVFGWNWWQSRQHADASEASALYQNWMDARQKGADDEALKALADSLRAKYPDSAYVTMLHFDAAARAVQAGRIDSARTELEAALAMDVPPSLKDIARLRLARLDLDDGRAEDALKRLDAIQGGDSVATVLELRGDAYHALGRNDDARSVYSEAITASGGSAPLVEMKRNELAAVAPVPATLETGQ